MLICTECNELSAEFGEKPTPGQWLSGVVLDCRGRWIPRYLGVVERNERLNHITPPPVLANAVIGIPVPVAPVPPAPPWAGPAGVKGSVDATATKPTNPKDAVGIKKTPFWLVPATIVGEIALALLEGARKYGAYNWRVAGVRASVYISAAEGHMKDWWEGEDTDPESQLSHITKALASLTVLRDAMIQGMWEDDRPPKSKVLPRQGNNARAAEIIERVRPNDPVAPFTAKKGE